MPTFVFPVTSGSGTLANVSAPSVSLHQVAGSPWEASRRSPGSILSTFEEATESTNRQMSSASSLSSVQKTFVGSLSSSVLISMDTQTAGALPSTIPSTSSTISLSRGEADLAILDHRYLIVSQSSDAPELLAVSGHAEVVETTHIPVQTLPVNPPSQGCTAFLWLTWSLSISA